jgi:hypothetical protein
MKTSILTILAYFVMMSVVMRAMYTLHSRVQTLLQILIKMAKLISSVMEQQMLL